MRHRCREHVVGFAELVEEALGLGDALVDRERRDARRIEEDAAGRNTQADLPRSRYRLERIPEHVHDGGDAGQQQLGEAEHATEP